MQTKHYKEESQNNGRSWQKLAPLFLLGLFLTITIFAWLGEKRANSNQSWARFNYETGRIEANLLDQLEAYKDTLRFATGFLAVQAKVSHADWSQFMSSLGRTMLFPEVPEIAYMEPHDVGGFSTTHIHATHDEPNHSAIPLAKEAAFSRNLEQVKKSGDTILTAHVPQILGHNKTSDIVLLVPVYATGSTVLKGIIAAGLDSRQFVDKALKQLSPEIHLEIFIGEDIGPSNNIFDSDEELVAGSSKDKATFSKLVHFNVGGEIWTILFMTTAQFDRATLQNHHYLFLIAGLGLSIAVWFAANLLASSRQRAVNLANEMIRALQSSEERLHLITDSVPVLIAYIDKNRQYQFANREFETWFGIAPEDIVGKTVQDLIGEAGYGNISGYIDQVLNGGKVSFEDIIETSNGEQRVIYATLVPHLSPEGDVVGYFALGEDITERKAEEEKNRELVENLERSNAELEQFAYVASHDLQEPLRMVSSYMQLIQRKYQGALDDEADEFINYAVEGAHRMRNMITDLLSYSRVGSKGVDFNTVSANNTAKMAIENLQSVIEEFQAKVTMDSLPAVHADEPQLTRLFQNLMGNAIKYRDPERIPEVHVSSSCNGNTATFHIKDNGIGIPDKQHDRVFMIFQRLHNRELYSGTGIGLAICKKIVERHSGKIWITSKEGEGSTFHFTLTIVDEEEDGRD